MNFVIAFLPGKTGWEIKFKAEWLGTQWENKEQGRQYPPSVSGEYLSHENSNNHLRLKINLVFLPEISLLPGGVKTF